MQTGVNLHCRTVRSSVKITGERKSGKRKKKAGIVSVKPYEPSSEKKGNGENAKKAKRRRKRKQRKRKGKVLKPQFPDPPSGNLPGRKIAPKSNPQPKSREPDCRRELRRVYQEIVENYAEQRKREIIFYPARQ